MMWESITISRVSYEYLAKLSKSSSVLIAGFKKLQAKNMSVLYVCSVNERSLALCSVAARVPSPSLCVSDWLLEPLSSSSDLPWPSCLQHTGGLQGSAHRQTHCYLNNLQEGKKLKSILRKLMTHGNKTSFDHPLWHNVKAQLVRSNSSVRPCKGSIQHWKPQ